MMRLDPLGWRDSRNYDYFDELSVEGLAWECLRRNDAYRKFYRSLVISAVDAELLPPEAELRWGLRFRRGSRSVRTEGGDPMVTPPQSGDAASDPKPRLLAKRIRRFERRRIGRQPPD